MTRRTLIRPLLIASTSVAAFVTGSRAEARAQVAQMAVDSSGRSRASSDTALESLTRRVSAQLRCPVCQGLSLADSPSELALEMKDVVRSQLAAGRTPDEVKAYFVAKYGEWILLEPPRRGVNLLAYGLPAIGLAAGAGVIWLALRRWTGNGTGPDEATATDVVD